MSNKDRNQQQSLVTETPAPQDNQEPAADETNNAPDTQHYLNFAPDPETGVIEFESFQYDEYSIGKEFKSQTDIQHLFTPEFAKKAVQYDFAWFPHYKVDDCGQRYFTKVNPNNHGAWFKKNSFQNGVIATGWDPKNGCKELILCVRSKRAALEETKQMLKLSNSINNPTSGEKATEQSDKIHAALPEKYGRMRPDLAPGLQTSTERWR